MIVTLTGGTGFVGGYVIRRLIEAGDRVRALARRPQPARDGVTWIAGSLEDEAALATLCEGAEAVVHVAGVISAPDAAGFDSGNRVGTLAMLHAAEAAGIGRFVHISSLAAREPQLSLYGASKRAAEDAVIASGLDWQIVRPPAIYGPGDMELRDLFRMARRGILLLPPRGRLSVIHADDLARLIVAMTHGDTAHGFYEPDDGKAGGWDHREFARALGVAVGRRTLAIPVPRPGLSLASRADRLVRGGRAKLTMDRVDYFCHPDWVADPQRNVPEALWVPEIPTPRGLRETADWYRVRKLI